MEITVKIPFQVATKQTIDVDHEEYKKRLLGFIDKLENHLFLDPEDYQYLLDLGVQKSELDTMVKEIQVFASYDENHSDIGFPYEHWIERLITLYETKEMTEKRLSDRIKLDERSRARRSS
jgi:hypothetical protein